jgi:hypothetical protein
MRAKTVLKAASSFDIIARPPKAPRTHSGKTAFTKRQYAIAVEGLRSEGVLIDALSTARVAERCLDWMDRQRMQAREKPSLASGKRPLAMHPGPRDGFANLGVDRLVAPPEFCR